MEYIVRAGLSDHKSSFTHLLNIILVQGSWKVGPIPGTASLIVNIEEMNLFPESRSNARMTY